MERETGDGRKVLEADGFLSSKFTKSTGCPSSPSPKRTTLLREETCRGDQKDSFSNPHFDYFKQKSP